jgi:hypothetical protein
MTETGMFKIIDPAAFWMDDQARLNPRIESPEIEVEAPPAEN